MEGAATAKLKEFLKIIPYTDAVAYEILEDHDRGSYRELLVQYPSRENEAIPAFLLVPKSLKIGPAVLIHHQHNGERHLGKSEVVGRMGNPLQAFGPALAEKGFVVLAPDSICFEDRRYNLKGTHADSEGDWLQHFNEMTYRLVSGDTLMRKVLDDASVGLSLLLNLPGVDSKRTGVLGHSYGGNTALFQAAVDERVRFTCSSGAVCTYRKKIEERTGLEMALAVPDFCNHFEIEDVVRAIAPRELLIVSATEDKYSRDADMIVEACSGSFALKSSSALKHLRYIGGHALTDERYRAIINWVLERMA
jgi:dienelactone hydrolase